MAYQKNKRKLNDRQTVTTSTTSDGSVRKTYTIKNGNTTRSQAINKDGSIRTTVTEYRQGGWVDRKTYTTPKYRTHKKSNAGYVPYREPKQRRVKAKKGDDLWVVLFFIIVLLMLVFN